MNIPLERHVTMWSDIWAFYCAPQHPPKIPPWFLCFEKHQKVTSLSQILHMLQGVKKYKNSTIYFRYLF